MVTMKKFIVWYFLPQISHPKSLVGLWNCLCCCMYAREAKLWSHRSQANSLSPMWFLIWTARLLADANLSPHTLHLCSAHIWTRVVSTSSHLKTFCHAFHSQNRPPPMSGPRSSSQQIMDLAVFGRGVGWQQQTKLPPMKRGNFGPKY